MLMSLVLQLLTFIIRVVTKAQIASAKLAYKQVRNAAISTKNTGSSWLDKKLSPQKSTEVKSRALRYSLTALKHTLKFIDFLLGLFFFYDIALVAVILLIVLGIALAGALIALGVFDSGASGSKVMGEATTAPVVSSASVTGGTMSGASIITGSTSVPAGMDATEWNKADDTQKALAATAISAAPMKFPGSKENDINNGHLVYRQGNTPVGYYDCSTFVSSVFEANGLNGSTGKKLKGKPYSFETGKKADLEGYMFTGDMISTWKSRSGVIIGTAGGSGWEDKLLPGDVLVNSQHVVMYVGKNSSGKRIIAHAASSHSSVFYDVSLTVKGKMVGIDDFSGSVNYMLRQDTTYIVRTTNIWK